MIADRQVLLQGGNGIRPWSAGNESMCGCHLPSNHRIVRCQACHECEESRFSHPYPTRRVFHPEFIGTVLTPNHIRPCLPVVHLRKIGYRNGESISPIIS